MSVVSDISEDIGEEICEEVYEGDDELGTDVDIRKHMTEALSESSDSGHDITVAKLQTGTNKTGAIEQFSDALARTVVEEALLINEIQERDKLNVSERPRPDGSQLPSGGGVGPIPNGRVDSNGYDPYLMQRLLRSEADPDEMTGTEKFDDQLDIDTRLQGLNTDDTYVREETERSNIDHNDQNNNEMDDGTAVTVAETMLQTIHEDSELDLKSHREPGEPGQTGEITEAVEGETVPAEQAEIKVQHEKKSIKFSTDRDEVSVTRASQHSKGGEGEDDVFSTSDESEEEQDCCEMTYKEKQAVVLAVRDGDIDLVELLLEKRNAHMDMLWDIVGLLQKPRNYSLEQAEVTRFLKKTDDIPLLCQYGETLLMVAIRMLQQKMAEFLIDNDIDLEYQTRIVERVNGVFTIHKMTARQMAFDRGLDDLVELIDYKTNNLFDFVKPKEREIRIRRPRPPTPPTPEVNSEDDISDDENTEHSDKDGSGRKKRTKSTDSGINHSTRERHHTDGSMSSFSDEESGHSTDGKSKTASHKTKSRYDSNDNLSQVFGPDEGYETMSPISPACVQAPNRLGRNIVVTKERVSIRGTKASHILRAHTAAKRQTYSDSSIESSPTNVGSYGFEKKRWNYCKSAPQPKNYSVESIPDTVVRYGLPFLHGTNRKLSRSADESQRNKKLNNVRNSSPYEEVVKILSGSRMLNTRSKSSSSLFPSIHEKSSVYRDNFPRNLNINYIYANRGSAATTRSISSIHTSNIANNLKTTSKHKVKT